jgi:hypothetical protein
VPGKISSPDQIVPCRSQVRCRKYQKAGLVANLCKESCSPSLVAHAAQPDHPCRSRFKLGDIPTPAGPHTDFLGNVMRVFLSLESCVGGENVWIVQEQREGNTGKFPVILRLVKLLALYDCRIMTYSLIMKCVRNAVLTLTRTSPLPCVMVVSRTLPAQNHVYNSAHVLFAISHVRGDRLKDSSCTTSHPSRTVTRTSSAGVLANFFLDASQPAVEAD